MEKILICPGDRPGVGYLSQTMPLVTMPLLGESLLGYWMEAAASCGTKELLILATDRPDAVRTVVGDGTRWGMRVEVRAELKELSREEAVLQYGPVRAVMPSHPLASVVVLDHFPALPDIPLFRSYRDWFSGLLACMSRPAELGRIGVREIRPQIWCGHRSRIAPSAQLRGPCWLGAHVQVGSDAIVGPNAILESGVVIDAAAEVCSSAIGPDTFVGSLTKVEGSIALGSTLIDWRTGSCTQVPDPFLLCALGQRTGEGSPGTGGWLRQGWSALIRRPWAGFIRLQDKLRQP